MLKKLGQNEIEKVISITEEILSLLGLSGYDHIEEIVSKTNTLSGICGDDVIRVWLWLELNGGQDYYLFNRLKLSEDAKREGFYIWTKIHKIKDSNKKEKLFDEFYQVTKGTVSRKEIIKKVRELKEKEFSLPFSNLDVASVSELVEIAKFGFEEPKEIKSNIDYVFFRERMFRHDNSSLIIRRLKNEIREYVTKLYKNALNRRDSLESELAILKEENEKLRSRLLISRIKRIYDIVRTHKLRAIIIGLILCIAAILTILMFFGVDFFDVIESISFR